MHHVLERFSRYVPNDFSKHVSGTFMVDKLIGERKSQRLLDLGCGEGATLEYFMEKDPTIEWHGVDIPSSPEVDRRKSNKKDNDKIIDYDGIHIPFTDNYFDIVYFAQVLEHVERPHELFKEIYRVLKPTGFLVGSVSYLELYHSFSTFNVTPYGLVKLAEQACLEPIELRPGVDCIALFFYYVLGKFRFFTPVLKYLIDEIGLPLNILVSILMRICGKSHRKINLVKLYFAGHIRFKMKKAT